MRRPCRRTPRLLDAALAGESMSPEARAHLEQCSDCRPVVLSAERFDRQLTAAATGLVTEPMPAASIVLRLPPAVPNRSTAVPALAAVVAAGVVITMAVIFGRQLGNVLPSSVGSPIAPSGAASSDAESPPPDIPAEMRDWVRSAPRAVMRSLDRPLAVVGPLVRLERCPDGIALAFWVNPGDDTFPYIFAGGPYRTPEAEQAVGGGLAVSIDDPEAAYQRAQRSAPCEIMIEAAPSRDEIRAAYRRFTDNATAPRPDPLAATMASPTIAFALLAQSNQSASEAIVELNLVDGQWMITRRQQSQFPRQPGAPVAITVMGTGSGEAANRELAVGWLQQAEPIAAVELDFEGFPHRYLIPSGSHAFIAQLPGTAGLGLRYRLLDGDGSVVTEGVSVP